MQKQHLVEEQLDNLVVFLDSQNPVNAAQAKEKTLCKLTLQEITLTSSEGFIPLLECLGRNRRLRHVNLSRNDLLLRQNQPVLPGGSVRTRPAKQKTPGAPARP